MKTSRSARVLDDQDEAVTSLTWGEPLAEQFRDAMSRFPSGVTVVTTCDEEGTPWGFTASAFCSVSLDPALVLVCLADSADCYGAFGSASRWVVNILADDQVDIAKRFATKGVDKFSGDDFERIDGNLSVLSSAVASLVCDAFERYPGGDHLILVGEVVAVRLGEGLPLLYYARGFPSLRP